MIRRLLVGGPMAAVAVAVLTAGLAGAQLGVLQDDPAPEKPGRTVTTKVPERQNVNVPPRRNPVQSTFEFGAARPFATPEGVTWDDTIVTNDGLVGVGRDELGAVIATSEDGEAWTPAFSGTIGAVDLANVRFDTVAASGAIAVGTSTSGDPMVAVVETDDLSSADGVLLDAAPPAIGGVDDWATLIDGVVDGPQADLVLGRLVGKPTKGFDPADPLAVRAVRVGVPVVFSGATVAQLAPVDLPGLGWLRDAVTTPTGLMAFGADADGYPAIWSMTGTGPFTQVQPAGLDRLDAVLAADSNGAQVSLVGVTIEGPMIWRSTDGGQSFTETSLAQRPEDIFDVFAEEVVITDDGTLVLATRRAPIVAPAAPTEEFARAESFIETLAWFVTPDGTVTRATGADLFGTDAQVIAASAADGSVMIRVADSIASERVVFVEF